MKTLLLFSSVLVTVLARLLPPEWNGLRVRYPTHLVDGYYKVPKTLDDPLIKNYELVPENFSLAIKVFCHPNDPRVCLMYDMSGIVAGIQISFLDQDVMSVNKSDYDYATLGGYERTKIFNIPAWSLRVYFTRKEWLTAKNPQGRQNKQASIDGLWVYLNGREYQISKSQPTGETAYYNQPKGKPFIKQGCFIGMGEHYFYNVDRSTSCSKVLPFFSIYDVETLVGFGIAGFGQGSSILGGRVWYEDVHTAPFSPFLKILPTRPKCVIPWGKKYGIYALHVFFVEKPWKAKCPLISIRN